VSEILGAPLFYPAALDSDMDAYSHSKQGNTNKEYACIHFTTPFL
jgi:hypothetical protein